MDEIFSFNCLKCFKSFKTHDLLTKHVHSKHDPMKKSKCDKCYCTFKSNSELNRHIKHSHLKQVLYNCQECEKSFSYKSALTLHQRRHAQKLVVPCIIDGCAFKFTNQAQRNYHIKIMHKGSIQCEHRDCFLKFANLEAYKAHHEKHSLYCKTQKNDLRNILRKKQQYLAKIKKQNEWLKTLMLRIKR